MSKRNPKSKPKTKLLATLKNLSVWVENNFNEEESQYLYKELKFALEETEFEFGDIFGTEGPERTILA